MPDEPADGLADPVTESTAPDDTGPAAHPSAPPGARSPRSDPRRPAPLETRRPPSGAALLIGRVVHLAVLGCAAGGLLWAWRGTPGGGVVMLGGALLAAALARLILPPRAAGPFASRRRLLDVLTYTFLGAGLVAIGLALPPP